jgi:hypothetical protein
MPHRFPGRRDDWEVTVKVYAWKEVARLDAPFAVSRRLALP